tara:strand:- start:640 stop:1479 length:840 start_codon:yes stop_codon:yes gene_type:complete
MSAINELREELARTETAQFVTTMLRDISATRLQSIRAAYEANERYFLELHGLMHLIHTYSAKKGIPLPPAEKGKVYVALTSNRRFYGTLNVDVMQALYEAKQKDPEASCVVIGQTGKQIIARTPKFAGMKPSYHAFAKDEPTPEEIVQMVEKLKQHAEVFVVHPTYVNAFEQKGKTTDLTHVPHTKAEEAKTFEYLIEPDIPRMLDFFKTQIRLVLFDRVVLETRLALTGARLMKMQRARERAEEMLISERRLIHKEVRTMQSMRLLETFTGYNNENTL